MLLTKLLGIKILVRDEATLISSHIGLLNRMAKQLFFFILNMLCDGFITIGSLNREYYLWYGIEEERLFLMPYAVDNKYFHNKHGVCESAS